jgi:hypothetical protein
VAASLWLLGLLVTVSGTLITTVSTSPAWAVRCAYYALVGFGAAGLWAWGNAWGRAGRALAGLVLAAGVVGGGYWCTG